jgi:hypothetical protein
MAVIMHRAHDGVNYMNLVVYIMLNAKCYCGEGRKAMIAQKMGRGTVSTENRRKPALFSGAGRKPRGNLRGPTQ